MLVRPRSYPHPVLSHFGDDVLDSAFQCTVAVQGTQTSYAAKVTARTSNKGIQDLVRAGRAEYAVHLECPATRYRGLFSSTDETFQFEVPATLVDGRVEVCSFILAKADIASYRNDRFHPDYDQLSFSVRRGDVLAVGLDQAFTADKHVDPLRRIPSIFVIVPDEDVRAPAIDIDTTGHKIRVSLAQPAYEMYAFLRQSQPLHPSLNSMVIVPALVLVLEEIRTAAQSADGLIPYEGRRWYGTLSRRLQDFRIDIRVPDSFRDSSLALAQRLIGEPLDAALTTLKSYEEETGD